MYMHITNHSWGVTLVQHLVSIKQVGKKDKRACFAYNMRVHTEQIPIYSCFIYLRQRLSVLAVLQKHWELHSASVAV